MGSDFLPLGEPPRVDRVIWTSALLIALLTAAAGAGAIWATHRLERHTADLFEHPFAVTNAALEARLAASALRNRVLFAVLTPDADLDQVEREEAALDEKLERDLAIVGAAYLGNMNEVSEAKTLAAQWKEARREVLSLAREGDFEQARRVLQSRASPLHDQVVEHLDRILAFARHKAAILADQAEYDAREGEQGLWAGLITFTLVIAAAGLMVGRAVRANLLHRDEALAMQDAHFRLALEAAPTGMLLVDAQGRIELINAQVERLFGYSRAELLGLGIDDLVPSEQRPAHAGLRQGYMAAPTTRPMGPGRQLWAQRKDGTRLAVEVGLTPLTTPRGALTLCSVLDVTERVRTTARMQDSLAEKETLLREVHHRVKNNLQIISSLLGVQANALTDEHCRAVLDASRSRVHTIALIHEALYQSDDLGQVAAGEYLRPLISHVASAASLGGAEPALSVEVDDVTLSMDRAVPIGLVVNELLTNACKHAFTGGSPGTVAVRLWRDGLDSLALEVSDDGRGVPTPVPGAPATLGMKLVGALARQLKGHLVSEPSVPHGTTVRLTFGSPS